MKKERIRIFVEVNLDPIPGWGHEPKDFVEHIQFTLNNAYSHYEPKVSFDQLLIEKEGENCVTKTS